MIPGTWSDSKDLPINPLHVKNNPHFSQHPCLLNKSDLSSLDFVINRLFMKLTFYAILGVLTIYAN